MKKLFVFILLVGSCLSCSDDSPAPNRYITQNVIVIVMDGPRYSETWGDPTHQYIPRLDNQLASKGIVYTNFYNNGPTYTVPGHTAITTGNYQEINNDGTQIPDFPSIFQLWRKAYDKIKEDSWIIASKDKLEVLANCENEQWTHQFEPSTDCGVNGNGSAYREDSITYDHALDILTTYHPQLVLINLKEPDYAAHQNSWPNYLQGIRDSDEFIYQLIQFIENDPLYTDKTTVFVTNDHGRHLDGVSSGFRSHGDDCMGCRHINLFSYGPDFKKDIITNIDRELIDIPATIAELLDFEIPETNGEVMTELFK